MQALNLGHVAESSATDSNDPVAAADQKAKLLAKALLALAAKLDADGGVTDTNYAATLNALTL